MVRHGQAGAFGSGAYDQLSPLGFEQAERLGVWLAAREPAIRLVAVGPLRRQRETWARLEASFEAVGRPLPEVVELPDLEEHQGEQVFLKALETLRGSGDALGALVDRVHESDSRDRLLLGETLIAVLQRWAEGGLADHAPEPFAAFRARVDRALHRLVALASAAQAGTALAVTSGGVIGAAVARALGASDSHALQAGLAVDNASLTEFLFSATGHHDRLSLKRFNGVAHLPASHLTQV